MNVVEYYNKLQIKTINTKDKYKSLYFFFNYFKKWLTDTYKLVWLLT